MEVKIANLGKTEKQFINQTELHESTFLKAVSKGTAAIVVLYLCWLVVNKFIDELLSRARSRWVGSMSIGQRG